MFDERLFSTATAPIFTEKRSAPRPRPPAARSTRRDIEAARLRLAVRNAALAAPTTPALESRQAAAEDRDPLESLVRAMCAREELALRQLHRACVGRVRACAMSIVHRPEVADEVVSSTFTQAWDGAAKFDRLRGTVIAWLLVITRSRALDALRRDTARGAHELPLVEDDADGVAAPEATQPCAVAESAQRIRALRAMVEKLARSQRQVVCLAFDHALSHEEIAAHLGLPVGTTKSHIRRGLKALRSQCVAMGIAP